jgi:D-alanine-D-alanine ligase
MTKVRIGILFGGKSVEHEVSLQSARNVYEAIDPAKFEIVLIGIDKTGRWEVRETKLLENAVGPNYELPSSNEASALAVLPGPALTDRKLATAQSRLPSLDVVFPLLHGTYGEDGTIQGLLKLAGIPCVGCSVLGSAVGMDKDITKRLLRDAGLPVARFVTLNARTADAVNFDSLAEQLGTPFFVKPANSGSSVGVSKVRNECEWAAARALALRFDHKILVEELITGHEIEVAVLGNDNPEASIPGEILPRHDFYSYEAKYLDENGAALKIPAALSPETSELVRRLAIQTFQVLEGRGMARVDFFVTNEGRAFVNEINTIPGFTKISMYPKLWAASGVSYSALIEKLVALAVESHARDQKLETTICPDLAP